MPRHGSKRFNISSEVSSVLPQHISNESPDIEVFLQKYLEFIETDNKSLYYLNTISRARDIDEAEDKITVEASTRLPTPIDLANNVVTQLQYDTGIEAVTGVYDTDIIDAAKVSIAAYTKAADPFLTQLQNEIGQAIPRKFSAEPKLLYKHLTELYKSRGTMDSIKAFFRFFYDDEVEIYFPKDDMFAPSDGKWFSQTDDIIANPSYYTPSYTYTLTSDTTVITGGDDNSDILTFDGLLVYVDDVKLSTINNVTGITQNINNVNYLSGPMNNLDAKNARFNVIVNNKVVPSAYEVSIANGGEMYEVNDIITIEGSFIGVGSVDGINDITITVHSVTETGAIDSITVEGTTPPPDFITSVKPSPIHGPQGELITNGTFNSNVDDWSSAYNSTISHNVYDDGNRLRVVWGSDESYANVTQTITGLTIGSQYTFKATIDTAIAGSIRVRISGIAFNSSTGNFTSFGVGTIEDSFTATSTTHTLEITDYGEDNSNIYHVDNVTFKELIPDREELDYFITFPTVIASGSVIKIYDTGTFTTHDGFLSSFKKLQDSYYYQKFSYVLRTGSNAELWENTFNRLIHPAGFIFFGEILLAIYLNSGILSLNQPGWQIAGLPHAIVIPVVQASSEWNELYNINPTAEFLLANKDNEDEYNEDEYTVTAATQTTFASSYNPTQLFVEVFVNGIKLLDEVDEATGDIEYAYIVSGDYIILNDAAVKDNIVVIRVIKGGINIQEWEFDKNYVEHFVVKSSVNYLFYEAIQTITHPVNTTYSISNDPANDIINWKRVTANTDGWDRSSYILKELTGRDIVVKNGTAYPEYFKHHVGEFGQREYFDAFKFKLNSPISNWSNTTFIDVTNKTVDGNVETEIHQSLYNTTTDTLISTTIV